MHIELTELLRCPQDHREEFLVLSTGEMSGRMVRGGVVGCPVCQCEYEIVDGVVEFAGVVSPEGLAGARGQAGAGATTRAPAPDPQTLQALLDLSGPGGYVALLGDAAHAAVGLAALMGGIHFIAVNPPAGVEELPVLSLLRTDARIPLRPSVVRAVVVGREWATPGGCAEALRVLLRGRRLVIEGEPADVPGARRLAVGQGLWVGEKS